MCTAASAEQRNGSARGTLNRSPSPPQNLVTALLIWVEGPPKGKDGRSLMQGLASPSGHCGCSPSRSLLSQPAGAIVYIPKPQVRLWGRNVLSTVTVGASASANVHAVGVCSSPSLLVISAGHLTPACPLRTQHLLPTTRVKGTLLLAQASSWQVCPNGVFRQHWSSAMMPTFCPVVLFSILQPSPMDFDSPEEGGDRCGKFSFSERGDEDAHMERQTLSIQSCRQSSWDLLGW